jgi:acyl dehydratase
LSFYQAGHEEKFSESHTITEEKIIEFGQRWDPQPFHTDPVAAEESIFGGLVASSVHLFAIAVKLGTSLPHQKRAAAVSALGCTNMQLRELGVHCRFVFELLMVGKPRAILTLA